MKPSVIVLASLISLISCSPESPRRDESIDQEQIIELDDGGSYIIRSKNSPIPQLVISITGNSYTIAQLPNNSPWSPPVVIRSDDGNISVARCFERDGAEIHLLDEDADGFPEMRLTIPDQQVQSARKPLIETISYTFTPATTSGQDAAEQGAAANP